MIRHELWQSNSHDAWISALESYEIVVDQQGVKPLPALDSWYRNELPLLVGSRKPMHATLEELVRLTEWKMARGVWRARNLALVRGNDPDRVVEVTTNALSQLPHPLKPIRDLSELSGVGPATASSLLSAAAPAIYPFFDELVAAQIPELPSVAFTTAYYAKYADAIRERSKLLGEHWTPSMVERALWAHVGGKAGARRKL